MVTMRPLALAFAMMLLAARIVMLRALAAMAPRRAAAFAAIVGTLSAVARARRRHGLLRQVLVGRRRQHGDALVGQAFDALELAALAAVTERDGDARGPGARCAADAMDVALGFGRQFVVDDVGHALDVDAAGGKVGSDQHAGTAAAEAV